MAFPAVGGTATTNGTTATTSAVINLPTGITAGETLLVLLRIAVGGTITWPAGWTRVFVSSGDASDDTTECRWRKADGTEGASITVTIPSSKFAALAWRITGASDPDLRPPQSSTVAVGTSTLPDPDSLFPSWGADDYLWFWMGGWEGEQTSPPAGNPPNYASNILGADSGTAGAVTTNCRVASATRQLNAASENPGSWTISVADDWSAWTVAVYPQTFLQEISPTGIASAQAFGLPIQAGPVTAVGITTAEVFGSAQLNLEIGAAGAIASAEMFGSPQLDLAVAPSGIGTAEVFGLSQLDLQVSPPSISSGEVFGAPIVSVSGGEQTLTPSGIASLELFGAPQLNLSLSPGGISSAEAFGNPIVSGGDEGGDGYNGDFRHRAKHLVLRG